MTSVAGFEAGSWMPLVYILVAGFLANDLWRFLGVLFSGRLSETSAVFTFVRSVATALVAGVIAELILFPGGSLARAALWLRVGAVLIGLAGYKATRGNILAGVLVGEAVFVAGWLATVG